MAQITSIWTAPRPGRLSLAGEFADVVGIVMEAVSPVWALDEFRPGEEHAYDRLLSEATARVRIAAEAMLLDAVVDAVAAFAAECPDAPRAGIG